VVAELELNSVIPPPDTNAYRIKQNYEEDIAVTISCETKKPALHAKVNSKRGINEDPIW